MVEKVFNKILHFAGTYATIYLCQSNLYGWIPEWPKGTDCKSAANCFGGSNPPPSICTLRCKAKLFRMHGQSTYSVRWCGGIGRRKGLKIPRGQPRAGSSPATSSNMRVEKTLKFQCFLYFFVCWVCV